MSKRKVLRTNPLRKYIIISLFVFFVIGIGYSVLSTDLNITSIISIDKYDHSLYGVLEKEAKKGTYAKEYTGAHQDSMNELLSTKKIYHWYAPSSAEGNTLANEILDKNNVLFGGFCWQMLRTTDTGGVKMIFNGIPNDGKCNNTGIAQQIDSSFYNDYSSLAFAGYMYNTIYTSYSNAHSKSMLSYTIPSSSYWYSDSVTWNSLTQKWELDNPKLQSPENCQSLIGKYTFNSSSSTTTSSQVRYIVAVNNSNTCRYYYINLNNGNDISYYNENYIYGDDYTDNGNGTYTINSPTAIDLLSYYQNISQINNKYFCINPTNNTCNDLWYITSANDTIMYYLRVSETYKYSSSFTYDNETRKYTLSNDSVTFWNVSDATNLASLNNHHYTCLNTTGECSSISYVHNVDPIKYIVYINLEDGKNIENAVNEMLYNDDVNTKNSTIKSTIDSWYQNNMTSYTNLLEDTIYCSDRSQSNLGENGWNPNGGDVRTEMSFKYSTSNANLICNNDTDKFSTSNSKARLIYPIGLMTIDEMIILGNNNLRKTGKGYWLNSSKNLGIGRYGAYLHHHIVSNDGSFAYMDGFAYGVRPAVSLKPGTEYTSGDGSKNNPYTVG